MVARTAASVVASESPVLVYDSAEFKQLAGITNEPQPSQGYTPSMYEQTLGVSREDSKFFNSNLNDPRSPQMLSSSGSFAGSLGSTDHKAKVYSLLPFLVEGAFTPKSFVLRLQLYPKANLLQFDTLQFTGVETIYMPTEQLIPITR